MAVSTARVREIRKQLDDAARDLEGSPEFAELADVVGQAAHAMDEMVDERGQMTEAAPVQVGSRVKRAEQPPADEADARDEATDPDEPGGDNADPDALGLKAKKRKLPPQFRR